MARRIFLHVGTPKSGTSYLQSLWWRHHDELAERGLLLPGERLRDHFRAASIVCERTEVIQRLAPRGRSTWDRLLKKAAAWDRDVLVSHELFAPASTEQADAAVRRLEAVADEVHLVVTARDLARQLRSDWQQNIKQGAEESLEDFWRRLRDHPTHGWWRFQDLPGLLDRWGARVPPTRTHLVVLPQSGAQPQEWLWEAVCRMLGVDPAGLDARSEQTNDSLGLVEVELVRRVQQAIPSAEHDLDMRRLTKDFFAPRILAPRGRAEPFVLPEAVHRWSVLRGSDAVAVLGPRGYDVIGRLDDLRPGPDPTPGRTPDQVTTVEVGDRAVEALAALLVHEKDRRRRQRGQDARPG